MHLDLDPAGRRVVVVGGERASRRAVARYRAAGAEVIACTTFAPAVPDDAVPVDAVLDGAALAVVVDGLPESVADAVRAACRRTGTLLSTEPAARESGAVTLVGGGPGALGLLTLDAVAALREADVVLYDRLAPTDALAELAPAAELVDVGKLPGHHRVPQSGINDLLVRHALAGRSVVRLKGGDPFVFGRGSEELAACLEARVPCRVIPGVSSAISVPAAAGIPVTHRDVSHLFTVVSGHAPLSDEEHLHLAGLGGTLVVLMGVSTLPQLVAGLGGAGMRPDMPVAVVERGYSASQRTTAGTLSTIVTAAGAARCQSPAVLVIGEVVRVGLDLQGGAAHLARLTESLAS
ncbi:uroporphyrinogen-III C-methyltransferase [Arthrobacter agilis]|uniref:uroporphyrinogen-III C-methyltransferase n=1 Tax=Arthrobacter agilis TaxID=37921 RepID=UPI00278A56F8|nr:uroporphyrinogen-III C-methyltransferase [Arthrobacter agilis]MDQ0735760.1 uroporphyrin-III C-methyltransferase [Arthrobacter agilis]